LEVWAFSNLSKSLSFKSGKTHIPLEKASTMASDVATQSQSVNETNNINRENGLPNLSQSNPSTSALQPPSENGTQVNGKQGHKSAAQKKREKRKQRRREGSVVSEVSDTESVTSLILKKSELTLL